MVETWYACDGRGVVFLNEEGTKPAYSAPDSLSEVVGELVLKEDTVPIRTVWQVTGTVGSQSIWTGISGISERNMCGGMQ